MDLQFLMDLAVDTAEQAAIKIIEVYREDDFDIQIKKDNSPVTRADLIAHKIIVDCLNNATKDIPVLSEESKTLEWQQRKQWQYYWLVDPLDGTKEFVDRNGEFTINIALIHDGLPVVGVVLAPAMRKIYLAAKGIGAFIKSNDNKNIAIKVRSVPLINGQAEFTFAIGRGSVPGSLKTLYTKFPQHKIIRLGSALKTCLIAEGKADLYPRYGKTSEWDTAAAQCILECAGGEVCDMQLIALKYNSSDSLLNPEFIAFGDKSIQWQNYLG